MARIKQFRVTPLPTFLLTASVLVCACVQATEKNSAIKGEKTIPKMDCVIEPSVVVDVGSAVPGIVETIHAELSDRVEKGKIVVQLESSVERATMDLAKLRAGLDTNIKLRQQSAWFDSLTNQRNKELLEKQAISLYDMDRSKTETNIARLQVTQEKENQSIAELEFIRAEKMLQRRTIRSPVDGVVLESYKSVGEYVEDEPLMRVAQLDPLHVEVIVPIEYIGLIETGMPADVQPFFSKTESYSAIVERVDPVADAASGTYGVRLSLPNPDHRIPAGMRCELDFRPLESADQDQLAANINAVPTVDPVSVESLFVGPVSVESVLPTRAVAEEAIGKVIPDTTSPEKE